ncbi:hypothetical protein Tco_0538343 [Tanacetum coccineum]
MSLDHLVGWARRMGYDVDLVLIQVMKSILLRATADKDAAKLFGSVNKKELVAECFFEVGDYIRAGWRMVEILTGQCGLKLHVACFTFNLLKHLPHVRAFKTKIHPLGFRDLPYYLEWEPDDISSEDLTYQKDENDTSISGKQEVKRASLEEELEGTTNADIDT